MSVSLCKRGSTFGGARASIREDALCIRKSKAIDYKGVVEKNMANTERKSADACMSPNVLHTDCGFAVSDTI